MISDIQRDILIPEKSVAAILRKAQILAYQLDNEEFKNWVDKELNGYPDQGKDYDEYKALLQALPGYRKAEGRAYGEIYTRFMHNPRAPIVIPQLFNEHRDELLVFHFTQGVPILERLLTEDGNVITEHWPDFMLLFINRNVAGPQGMTCASAWKEAPTSAIGSILETVKDRLLKFTLELQRLYPDLEKNPQHVSSDKVSQIYHVTIGEGGKMSVFDQSNQSVQGNQYNAARDINMGGVHDIGEFVIELEKLQSVLNRAIEAGELEEDAATDAKNHLTKALQQANKPTPEKAKILEHLEKVKDILKGFMGMAGAVVTLSKAAEVLDKIL